MKLIDNFFRGEEIAISISKLIGAVMFGDVRAE
jgi:hypothetical protein